MTAGGESDLVRRGYDALSYHYRSDDAGEDRYAPWLAELRARRLVQAGAFIRADATAIEFPPRSFGAVVCLYVLIHLPLAAQPGLVQRATGWLRPAGWLLAVTGHSTPAA